MKILVICNNSTFIKHIIDHLNENGHKVDLIKSHHSGTGKLRTQIINALKNKKYIPKMQKKFNNYDLIWCEWVQAAILSQSSKTKTPIILRIHDPFSPYLEKLKPEKFKLIITPSQTSKKWLDYHFKLNPNSEVPPIKIIGNALNPKYLKYVPNIFIEKRKRRYKICSVGNLNSRKRMIDLIELIKHARKQLKTNYQLTIIGRGLDQPYIQQLAYKYDWLIYSDWIHDLKEFYKDQDFFIANSYYESFGVSMVDAITQGCAPLEYSELIEQSVLNHSRYYYNSISDFLNKLNYYNEQKLENIEKGLKTLRKFILGKYHIDKISNEILIEFGKLIK